MNSIHMISVNGKRMPLKRAMIAMDNEILGTMYNTRSKLSDQKFVNQYCKLHESKFKKTFNVDEIIESGMVGAIELDD